MAEEAEKQWYRIYVRERETKMCAYLVQSSSRLDTLSSTGLGYYVDGELRNMTLESSEQYDFEVYVIKPYAEKCDAPKSEPVVEPEPKVVFHGAKLEPRVEFDTDFPRTMANILVKYPWIYRAVLLMAQDNGVYVDPKFRLRLFDWTLERMEYTLKALVISWEDGQDPKFITDIFETFVIGEHLEQERLIHMLDTARFPKGLSGRTVSAILNDIFDGSLGRTSGVAHPRIFIQGGETNDDS